MGLTYSILKVKPTHKAKKFIEVKFLIDSGAVYSLVPQKQTIPLRIKPYKKIEFLLADGSQITRENGDAYFELDRNGGAAPVIFGEDMDEHLLGTATLEALGLVLNPFSRELSKMKMLLA
jgi:predicted aspartyl protease